MAYPTEDERVVHRGSWGRIEYAVRLDDSMPAREFIDGLADQDKRKIVVLFERLTNDSRGTLHNREQFKKLDGEIFEFKRHQIRIGCFQVGRTWFLTHGFIKKQDKWPSQEVRRANEIRREHVSRPQPETTG